MYSSATKFYSFFFMSVHNIGLMSPHLPVNATVKSKCLCADHVAFNMKIYCTRVSFLSSFNHSFFLNVLIPFFSSLAFFLSVPLVFFLCSFVLPYCAPFFSLIVFYPSYRRSSRKDISNDISIELLLLDMILLVLNI